MTRARLSAHTTHRFYSPRRARSTPSTHPPAIAMSLVALLEGCKDVAMAKREEVAARAAEDVAEFEEYGEDLVRAHGQ